MTYTVAQGDCLSSIARAHGFADWTTIYNDPNNADFRRLRPDPNVIFPGDQLFIPDPEQRIEDRATDATHTFQKDIKPVKLRVVLLDQDHKPLANAAYKLEVAQSVFQGQTGADGLLEQVIPPDATDGHLSMQVTLPTGESTGCTWDLKLGALDPVAHMTGIQGRLNNLGYNTGPVDNVQGPRTTQAIKDFQEKYGLQVDGVAGPKTQKKLVEVYGC